MGEEKSPRLGEKDVSDAFQEQKNTERAIRIRELVSTSIYSGYYYGDKVMSLMSLNKVNLLKSFK